MFTFRDLDELTRALMLAEIDFDEQRGEIYDSQRLSATGKAEFPSLLRRAAKEFDDVWLANELRQAGRINQMETYTRNGKTHTRKVGSNAHAMLAEGEFNRFYTRALCLRAIKEKIETLVIYRGKDVSVPRPGSEQLIGTFVSPIRLLEDLRSNVGIETALGVPGGPNSGVTVCLPTTYSTIS